MRDTQRKKVYDSEKAAIDDIYKNKFTWKETVSFANHLKNSSYYVQNRGWKRIKLGYGKGCRSAYYYPCSKRIELPIWARNPFVICHEFAHALAH